MPTLFQIFQIEVRNKHFYLNTEPMPSFEGAYSYIDLSHVQLISFETDCFYGTWTRRLGIQVYGDSPAGIMLSVIESILTSPKHISYYIIHTSYQILQAGYHFILNFFWIWYILELFHLWPLVNKNQQNLTTMFFHQSFCPDIIHCLIPWYTFFLHFISNLGVKCHKNVVRT